MPTFQFEFNESTPILGPALRTSAVGGAMKYQGKGIHQRMGADAREAWQAALICDGLNVAASCGSVCPLLTERFDIMTPSSHYSCA